MQVSDENTLIATTLKYLDKMHNIDHDYMWTLCVSTQLNFNSTPKTDRNSDSEKVNHPVQQQHEGDNCSGQESSVRHKCGEFKPKSSP